MIIRKADARDLSFFKDLDPIFASDPRRRELVAESVAEGRALVVVDAGEALGYGAVTHHFFGYSFIELVYIRESDRGRGLGQELIRRLERLSRTKKIFTSTNQSNAHMQHLLSREGYWQVGIIHELDDADPELIYVKELTDV